ncbi:MAG: hypothetical protein ACM34F_12050 [Betaproteobacteria bacterium]
MRNSLTSGAMVEAAVTVAVAILMTVAGFEMLMGSVEDAALALHPATVIHAISTLQSHETTMGLIVASIRLPHVDAAQG